MTTKFNQGVFKGDTYTKQVSFSKAVLWKDKQISLSTIITRQFKPNRTKFIIFEDAKKGERWTSTYEKLKEVKIKKREGQEEQYYFPMSAFKITKIEKDQKKLI